MERRQQERRVGGRRHSDRPAKRRRLALLVLMAGLLAAVMSWAGLSRMLGLQVVVPPELIGVWKTSAPGYVERALEFTRGSVLLHTDDYHFSVHRILRLTQERHGLSTTFRIEYQDVDAVTPMVFRLVPSPRPLIRIDHFSGVWRREPTQ